MKLPIVGGSYQMDALSFDVQRTINFYPLISEIGTSKEVTALRGTAGLLERYDVGTGSIRGMISSASNRAFALSGNTLYELYEDGTSTSRGTINTFSGFVSFAENNAGQVMFVDGVDGWIFNLSTNTLTKITDADFPTCSYVTFQDQYFIVAATGTSNFYISAINDGTSWDALDFTSVESDPDDLVGVLSNNQVLYAFGNRSVEIFQNTGSATFPFERIDGAIVQTGCANMFTVQKFDNGVIWLGVDENGRGIVWQMNGLNDARRVSTQAIELLIDSANDYTDSSSWTYHEQGHIFYCLQIAGLDTTLVYDGSTGQWHERSWQNPITSGRERHRGSCHMFFGQFNLVGDRENGKIYRMDLNIYLDNGDEIVRERICPHIADEKRMISHASLELDMEVGVGLDTGQGSDPQVMMRYSDDGGRNWSNELWESLGKVGAYNTRVIWRRLGQSRDRVYHIKISDPVQCQINGAYLNSGS